MRKLKPFSLPPCQGGAGGGLVFALLISVLLLSSCKTSKQAVSPNKKADLSNLEAVLDSGKTRFTTLTMKGKGKYETEKESQSFNYKINIYKDSLILVTLSKLGVEGARILITPDTLKMMDRIQKQYRIETFGFVSERVGAPVDFNNLQALLLADVPFGWKELAVDKKEGGKIMLTSEKNKNRFTFTLNTKTLKLDAISMIDALNAWSMTYQRFQSVKNQNIPFEITSSTAGEGSQKKLALTHDAVEIDPETLSFNFNIPENYELQK